MSTQRRSDSDLGGIRLASDGWRDLLDLPAAGGPGTRGAYVPPGAWLEQFLNARFSSLLESPLFGWLAGGFSPLAWLRMEQTRLLDSLPLLLSEEGVLRRLAGYGEPEARHLSRLGGSRPAAAVSPIGSIQPVPVVLEPGMSDGGYLEEALLTTGRGGEEAWAEGLEALLDPWTVSSGLPVLPGVAAGEIARFTGMAPLSGGRRTGQAVGSPDRWSFLQGIVPRFEGTLSELEPSRPSTPRRGVSAGAQVPAGASSAFEHPGAGERESIPPFRPAAPIEGRVAPETTGSTVIEGAPIRPVRPAVVPESLPLLRGQRAPAGEDLPLERPVGSAQPVLSSVAGSPVGVPDAVSGPSSPLISQPWLESTVTSVEGARAANPLVQPSAEAAGSLSPSYRATEVSGVTTASSDRQAGLDVSPAGPVVRPEGLEPASARLPVSEEERPGERLIVSPEGARAGLEGGRTTILDLEAPVGGQARLEPVAGPAPVRLEGGTVRPALAADEAGWPALLASPERAGGAAAGDLPAGLEPARQTTASATATSAIPAVVPPITVGEAVRPMDVGRLEVRPSAPAGAPEPRSLALEQPAVAPDRPVVAPEQPAVAPDRPVVSPDRPLVAPPGAIEHPVLSGPSPATRIDPDALVSTLARPVGLEPISTPVLEPLSPVVSGAASERSRLRREAGEVAAVPVITPERPAPASGTPVMDRESWPSLLAGRPEQAEDVRLEAGARPAAVVSGRETPSIQTHQTAPVTPAYVSAAQPPVEAGAAIRPTPDGEQAPVLEAGAPSMATVVRPSSEPVAGQSLTARTEGAPAEKAGVATSSAERSVAVRSDEVEPVQVATPASSQAGLPLPAPLEGRSVLSSLEVTESRPLSLEAPVRHLAPEEMISSPVLPVQLGTETPVDELVTRTRPFSMLEVDPLARTESAPAATIQASMQALPTVDADRLPLLVGGPGSSAEAEQPAPVPSRAVTPVAAQAERVPAPAAASAGVEMPGLSAPVPASTEAVAGRAVASIEASIMPERGAHDVAASAEPARVSATTAGPVVSTETPVRDVPVSSSAPLPVVTVQAPWLREVATADESGAYDEVAPLVVRPESRALSATEEAAPARWIEQVEALASSFERAGVTGLSVESGLEAAGREPGWPLVLEAFSFNEALARLAGWEEAPRGGESVRATGFTAPVEPLEQLLRASAEIGVAGESLTPAWSALSVAGPESRGAAPRSTSGEQAGAPVVGPGTSPAAHREAALSELKAELEGTGAGRGERGPVVAPERTPGAAARSLIDVEALALLVPDLRLEAVASSQIETSGIGPVVRPDLSGRRMEAERREAGVSVEGRPGVASGPRPSISLEGQPIPSAWRVAVSDAGQPLVVDGRLSLIAPDGRAVVSPELRPQLAPDGRTLVAADGHPLLTVAGRALTTADLPAGLAVLPSAPGELAPHVAASRTAGLVGGGLEALFERGLSPMGRLWAAEPEAAAPEMAVPGERAVVAPVAGASRGGEALARSIDTLLYSLERPGMPGAVEADEAPRAAWPFNLMPPELRVAAAQAVAGESRGEPLEIVRPRSVPAAGAMPEIERAAAVGPVVGLEPSNLPAWVVPALEAWIRYESADRPGEAPAGGEAAAWRAGDALPVEPGMVRVRPPETQAARPVEGPTESPEAWVAANIGAEAWLGEAVAPVAWSDTAVAQSWLAMSAEGATGEGRGPVATPIAPAGLVPVRDPMTGAVVLVDASRQEEALAGGAPTARVLGSLAAGVWIDEATGSMAASPTGAVRTGTPAAAGTPRGPMAGLVAGGTTPGILFERREGGGAVDVVRPLPRGQRGADAGDGLEPEAGPAMPDVTALAAELPALAAASGSASGTDRPVVAPERIAAEGLAQVASASLESVLAGFPYLAESVAAGGASAPSGAPAPGQALAVSLERLMAHIDRSYPGSVAEILAGGRAPAAPLELDDSLAPVRPATYGVGGAAERPVAWTTDDEVSFEVVVDRRGRAEEAQPESRPAARAAVRAEVPERAQPGRFSLLGEGLSRMTALAAEPAWQEPRPMPEPAVPAAGPGGDPSILAAREALLRQWGVSASDTGARVHPVTQALSSREPVARDISGEAQGMYMAPRPGGGPHGDSMRSPEQGGTVEIEVRGIEQVAAELKWRMQLAQRWDAELE